MLFSQKNTLQFSNYLLSLGIDLQTEIAIRDEAVPSVSDFYAILEATRTLLQHDIPIPYCPGGAVGNLTIRQEWEINGRLNVTLSGIFIFDDNNRLFKTSFRVTEDPKEKNPKELRVLQFDDVDIGMLVTIPELFSQLANYVYRMIYNNDYEPDYVHFADMLEVSASGKEHSILLNGASYMQVSSDCITALDKEKGIMDLVMLQGLILIRQYPEVDNFNFTYDKDLRVLAADTDL